MVSPKSSHDSDHHIDVVAGHGIHPQEHGTLDNPLELGVPGERAQIETMDKGRQPAAPFAVVKLQGIDPGGRELSGVALGPLVEPSQLSGVHEVNLA